MAATTATTDIMATIMVTTGIIMAIGGITGIGGIITITDIVITDMATMGIATMAACALPAPISAMKANIAIRTAIDARNERDLVLGGNPSNG